MSDRIRLIVVVIFVLAAISSAVAGITIGLLYNAAFSEIQARLVETVKSQARLMEAVARFDARYSQHDHPSGAAAATLSQIQEAHQQYEGFGTTGEFMLAHRQGEQIVWLLSHCRVEQDVLEPIPFDSDLAEPMRRALLGQSGTMVGLDYRGEMVLAAYEPVAKLDWGIVAKIDLAEVRAPFVKTGLVTGVSALFLILIGAGLSIRATNPLLARLERSEAQQRAILASAVDPVVTIDADGVIQSVSDSIERILGWKPNDLIGKNIRLLVPEPQRSDHDAHLADLRRTGDASILGQTRELSAVCRNGRTIPIELSVSRVDSLETDRPLFAGVIHDIADRRANERAMTQHRERLEELVAERTAALEVTHEQLRITDRLASIGTLAAGLGHDMSNVLLPVRCRLDALDDAPLSTEARRQLQAIRASVEYLQQLTDGLHLLALDPDDPVASSEIVDLAVWWKQAGPLLTKAVPKHVRLVTDWPQDLAPVAVPPHRLTQAVLNLLVNAGEAVGRDGLIRLWAEPVAEHDAVRLAVTDNGCGMTPQIRRRALDPFFTTKKRGLGTGLGLSLVQSVARSAGGSLEIDSAPGQGTTVTLVLPTAADARLAQARARSAPRLTAVVSVEDRRIASLVSACLDAASFEVKSDQTGAPGPSALWVTDASCDTLEQARRFLNEPGRHVLVLGGASEAWTDLGVTIVQDPTDFQQVRHRIEQAAATLSGARS